MTPERRKHVKQVLGSVLERKTAERAAFLAEVCAGDESLRDQVAALIEAHEGATNFFEMPPAVAAEVTAADHAKAMVGRLLGHYKILSRLGAGGMGEVYLARDTRLRRKVALKLLPSHLTAAKERVQRLQHEAYAASALNHPNFPTIYEVGQAELLPHN